MLHLRRAALVGALGLAALAPAASAGLYNADVYRGFRTPKPGRLMLGVAWVRHPDVLARLEGVPVSRIEWFAEMAVDCKRRVVVVRGGRRRVIFRLFNRWTELHVVGRPRAILAIGGLPRKRAGCVGHLFVYTGAQPQSGYDPQMRGAIYFRPRRR